MEKDTERVKSIAQGRNTTTRSWFEPNPSRPRLEGLNHASNYRIFFLKFNIAANKIATWREENHDLTLTYAQASVSCLSYLHNFFPWTIHCKHIYTQMVWLDHCYSNHRWHTGWNHMHSTKLTSWKNSKHSLHFIRLHESKQLALGVKGQKIYLGDTRNPESETNFGFMLVFFWRAMEILRFQN